MVGTVVNPFASEFDPASSDETRHGTGGRVRFAKRGGKWRGGLAGRWESDKLDPNDLEKRGVGPDSNLHGISVYPEAE